MAPPKVMLGQNRQNNVTGTRKGVTTRSQKSMLDNVFKHTTINKDTRNKRKAEEVLPTKEKIRRLALGNITNAIGKSLAGTNHAPKKVVSQFQPLSENSIPVQKPVVKYAVKTYANAAAKLKLTTAQAKPKKEEINVAIVNIKRSLDLEKSNDTSLYVSALEDVVDSTKKTRSSTVEVQISENKEEKSEKLELVIVENEEKKEEASKKKFTDLQNAIPSRNPPSNVECNFDVENWLDPFQVSEYAMDIFEYLKEREGCYVIGNYMERQVCLSRWMRALLVDWMVEVQESFELNHETLYLGVKLVDMYLTKVTVGKETLQLLGAASLFIASKFDERIPPMVEDFLYICDGAYSQRELIRMEMNILKVVNFDLGIPLSYRFLRRYARCTKVSMPTLTLARYILEYSLMDYSMITFSDSKMAAAALLLALRMKDLGGWTPTLEYYSGYKIDEIRDICNFLNHGLHRKHKEDLMNVRNKYSHKIFFEVAKLPLIDKLDI